MAETGHSHEDIRRTPPGRWEKIGIVVTLAPVAPIFPISAALEALGLALWERIAVSLLVFGIAAYFLFRRVRRERVQRQATDLGRGVFECGIRFPRARPGSLSDVWEFGSARLRDGTLQVQGQVGDLDATPVGRLKTFANATLTEEPEGNRPPKLAAGYRRWPATFLQTDGGLLQVIAPPTATAVLKKGLDRPARPPGTGNHG